MDTTTVPAQSARLIGAREGLLNLLIMIGLACALSAWFGPRPLWATAAAGRSWPLQVACGVAVGLAFAIPTWIVVLKIEALDAFKNQMLELAQRIDLRGLNPLWLGLCAGIGEEALARGSLQPLIGIWWTSLLFTIAHYQTGKFRSMNLAKAIYAAFVFLASLLMSYVALQVGLIAAMIAHSVVDIYGFLNIRKTSR